MACLPHSSWVAPCSCLGTWHPTTVTGRPTCRPGVWVPWRPVWDLPSPCPRRWRCEPMLSMITWWLSMPTAQWPLTTTLDVWVATSGGLHERALGGQGIGWNLHPGRTLAPSPLVPGCLPDQHGSQWHCWGSLGRRLPGGLSARWIFWFLWHRTIGIYLPTVARDGLQGRALQYKYATGPVLEGLQTLCLFPGHAEPWCALGGRHRRIQGIRLPLQWGLDQMPPGIGHAHICPHIYIRWQWPRVLSRPPVHIRGIQRQCLDFISFHCHGHSAIIMLPAIFGLGI